MEARTTRREFMRATSLAAATLSATARSGRIAAAAPKRDYEISLAAWSLHRTIGTGEKQTPMLDMPKLARQEFDIGAIELVNRMVAPYRESFTDQKPYLDQLAKNASDNHVKILLIMVDGEGNIGDRRKEMRNQAVERHSKWIDIAEYFGCHSIRMNWGGAPRGVEKDAAALQQFIERSVPGFRKLCKYGDKRNVNVIIENHGGPSSYPDAMDKLVAAVDHERFGTLPDFGNFPDDVDLYAGIDSFMKHAKAVSAKCYDFDEETGEETTLDYGRLIGIVVEKHGYHGFIGIEYEGDRLSEFEGIKACKRLLERLRA
jgi:sugar phosphate isomerase/epimerase